MHEKLAYVIKHVPLVQWIYRLVMGCFFRTVGLFVRTDDTLVLLSSYSGKQFSDSPRVLFEALKADPRFQGLRYVWAFEQPERFSVPGADLVRIDSLAYFITALRARVWITNVNIERGLRFKKKNTIYLNTWHGTGPKKSGNAVRGRHDYDFSCVDIFCCTGEYCKWLFTNWFGVRESALLWCGRPREDELMAFTDEDRRRVREKLGVGEDKKVILYMPTWREYGNRIPDLTLWEETLGPDYVVFLRAHHFSKVSLDGVSLPDFWRKVTDYPNVNELYLAADILISDYSSAFFDYGLLAKPMLCYGYDYDQYKQTTGLFFELEDGFPHGVIRSEEQLLQTILHLDYASECQAVREYCSKFVFHNGNATACCLDRLHELMIGGKKSSC